MWDDILIFSAASLASFTLWRAFYNLVGSFFPASEEKLYTVSLLLKSLSHACWVGLQTLQQPAHQTVSVCWFLCCSGGTPRALAMPLVPQRRQRELGITKESPPGLSDLLFCLLIPAINSVFGSSVKEACWSGGLEMPWAPWAQTHLKHFCLSRLHTAEKAET